MWLPEMRLLEMRLVGLVGFCCHAVVFSSATALALEVFKVVVLSPCLRASKLHVYAAKLGGLQKFSMRSSVSHLVRGPQRCRRARRRRAASSGISIMMRWLVCGFMLAFGVRAWQLGPAAQRLAASSARRAAVARGARDSAATDAIAATDALAAEDARLVAEARAATEAGDQAAARIALAELEDVRAQAARPPCKTPPPNAELLRLVDKLGQSRRYIAYLKLHRTELRRLSTRTVLARRAAEVPLADLAPPLTRPTESSEARAAVEALIREAEAENTAVAWEAVEEVLARDNSVACAPSLDDEDVVDDDLINLEVELALEHLEALACRAEMSGAFSSLRRQV